MSCALPGFANPTIEEARRCALSTLPHEILYTSPEIIVTLGAVACGALFPDCDLSMEHGLPRYVTLPPPYSWSGIHVPCYHPAAGLHESEFMIPLQSDFSNLRLIHRGEFVMPHDPYPNPTYQEVESNTHLSSILEARGLASELAMDTETLPPPVNRLQPIPWCLSFSHTPGTAYVVRAHRHDILESLSQWIVTHSPLVILHNSLFDLHVLSVMGIHIPRWMDTMQLAYILMDVPQGLKALAYRLCGMTMQSFDDLVLPYAREQVLAYLNDLDSSIVSMGWMPPTKPKLPPLPRKSKKAGDSGFLIDMLCNLGARAAVEEERARLLEIHSQAHQSFMADPLTGAAKKLRRLILDMGKDPSVSPWKRWGAWDEAECETLSSLAGSPPPPPSINQVPLPLAIHYAGRDSDATLRVRHALLALARDLRRRVS
jgi:hypothetical protein